MIQTVTHRKRPSLLLLFFFNLRFISLASVCGYIHKSRGSLEATGPLKQKSEVAVSCPVWLPGAKFRFSAKVLGALNHQASSPSRLGLPIPSFSFLLLQNCFWVLPILRMTQNMRELADDHVFKIQTSMFIYWHVHCAWCSLHKVCMMHLEHALQFLLTSPFAPTHQSSHSPTTWFHISIWILGYKIKRKSDIYLPDTDLICFTW